jgi:hypothetical protein
MRPAGTSRQAQAYLDPRGLNLNRTWNKSPLCEFWALSLGGLQKMLTTLATLTPPVVVLTILIVAVYEIKDAWDRSRIK